MCVYIYIAPHKEKVHFVLTLRLMHAIIRVVFVLFERVCVYIYKHFFYKKNKSKYLFFNLII